MIAKTNRRLDINSIVAVSYIILTILLFLPIFPYFTTEIAVRGDVGKEDGWQNVWMLWWTYRSLITGNNPFFTTDLFYPTGVNLFWQTLNITNGLLAIPITAILGPIAAFNSIAMATFVFSGYTMFLLAFRVVGSARAAWLAGLMFAFSPFHLTKLYDGQLEMMSVQYFPLYILFLTYTFEQRKPRFAWFSGFVLFWITLTSLYYGLFSVIFLLVYLLLVCIYIPFRDPRNVRDIFKTDILYIIKQGVIIIAPLSLIIIPNLIGIRFSEGIANWESRQILRSATPIDFILPSPYSPIWGRYIQDFQQSIHPETGGIGTNISLGVTVLLLAFLSIILSSKHTKKYALLTGIMMVFAMGPYLVINGQVTSLKLPFSLFNYLPAVKFGQRPNHIIVIVSVYLCLMAAFGWRAIEQRISPKQKQLAFIIVLIFLAVDLWPSRLVRSDIGISSEFYENIPHDTTGAIIDIPAQLDKSNTLRAQLIHHRPIIGGYISRIPRYDFVYHVEGVRQLWNLRNHRESILYNNWTEAVPWAMAAYNIEYIILHTDILDADTLKTLNDALSSQLKLVYHDQAMIVYQRPIEIQPRPILNLLQGWHQFEATGERRWQWTDENANFNVMNPLKSAAPIFVEIKASTFLPNKPVQLYQQIDMEWREVAAYIPMSGDKLYTIPLLVEPGETLFQFRTEGSLSLESSPRELGLSVTYLKLVLRK